MILAAEIIGTLFVITGVVIWLTSQAPVIEDPEIEIRDSDFDRLREIHLQAIWLNEQLEHLAAEACRINHVDPESEGIERDWCDEIVFHRTPPIVIVNRLARKRRELHVDHI